MGFIRLWAGNSFPRIPLRNRQFQDLFLKKSLAFSDVRWYTHFNNLHMEAHSMVTVSTCAQFYFSYYYFFHGKR